MNTQEKMQGEHRTLWYPKARPDRRPSSLWYFGRAVYVSRHDYRKAFVVFVVVGLFSGCVAVWTGLPFFWNLLSFLVVLGFFLFFCSLFGLYCIYGPPSHRYFAQLIKFGELQDGITIADLHVGTYRHSYSLAQLLPRAKIYSIDCWNVQEKPSEGALGDIRELEVAPIEHVNISPCHTENYKTPLKGECCDAVVLGFGAHEIVKGESRHLLFSEIQRISKKGGTVLLFEHGRDLPNFLVFGPAIWHFASRREWTEWLNRYFDNVTYQRSPLAVDLFRALNQK